MLAWEGGMKATVSLSSAHFSVIVDFCSFPDSKVGGVGCGMNGERGVFVFNEC